MQQSLEKSSKVSCKDVLADVHAELYFFGADVVLKLAADGEEATVVAADDLVLQKTLFKGMGFFV
jgi:hypothetical protein